jgi:High potential iron-sulfur protein
LHLNCFDSIPLETTKKEEHKMNVDLDKMISRRTLLKGAAAVTCVALASAFAGKAFAAKSTKAAANYQDKPNGDKKCSNCNLFTPGKTPKADGTCQVVDGSISPEAYCTLYSKKE